MPVTDQAYSCDEIAVALKLAQEAPSTLCFGLFLEAQNAAQRASGLEVLARRIELSPAVIDQILRGEYDHAEIIATAHFFFRAMAEDEQEFRAFIAGALRRRNAKAARSAA